MTDLRNKVLHQLQTLIFNSRLEDGKASDKADVLRCILGDVHLACNNKLVAADGKNLVSKSFTESYTNIVDSLDENAGLNNFAEGALSICSVHRNESQKWRSSFSKENILNFPCVKTVLQKNKELSSNTPAHKVLFTKSSASCSTDQSRQQMRVRPGQVNSDSTAQPTTTSIRDAQDNRVPPWNRINSSKERIWCDSSENSLNKTGIDSLNQVNARGRFGGGFRGDGENSLSSRVEGNRKPLFATGSNGTCNTGFVQIGSGETKSRSWRDQQGSGLKRPYQDSEMEPCEEESDCRGVGIFRTAKEQYSIDNQKKYGRGRGQTSSSNFSYGTNKKSLGTRRGPTSKFVPPVLRRDEEENEGNGVTMDAVQRSVVGKGKSSSNNEEPTDPRLKGIEPKMIELVMNEIMDHGPQIGWDDIAGLEFAKKTIKEIVVWPMLRPDIFTGLRGPPKGLLLFGPPGTGKTLIGGNVGVTHGLPDLKWSDVETVRQMMDHAFVATTMSCSSLSPIENLDTVGEGEKMVRALFAVARCHQPAVVFIDEIDSLLSQRSDGENEASRRIKTEFLVQLDGAATVSDDRILVIGATNRPQEIDEAARRRFVKRLYIPLPESLARRHIVLNLLSQQHYELQDVELDVICQRTDGYSGADMANLCREAALGPIRSMAFADIENISADQVRPILFQDFEEALLQVRASVSDKDLDLYIEWNSMYGSASIKK